MRQLEGSGTDSARQPQLTAHWANHSPLDGEGGCVARGRLWGCDRAELLGALITQTRWRVTLHRDLLRGCSDLVDGVHRPRAESHGRQALPWPIGGVGRTGRRRSHILGGRCLVRSRLADARGLGRRWAQHDGGRAPGCDGSGAAGAVASAICRKSHGRGPGGCIWQAQNLRSNIFRSEGASNDGDRGVPDPRGAFLRVARAGVGGGRGHVAMGPSPAEARAVAVVLGPE